MLEAKAVVKELYLSGLDSFLKISNYQYKMIKRLYQQI